MDKIFLYLLKLNAKVLKIGIATKFFPHFYYLLSSLCMYKGFLRQLWSITTLFRGHFQNKKGLPFLWQTFIPVLPLILYLSTFLPLWI